MKKWINNILIPTYLDMLWEVFWNRLKKIYSIVDFKIIEEGFSLKSRKPSFRINTLKSNENEILSILKENGLIINKINYLENCYILENWKEKDLWDLKIFHEWKIYMQQVSSQIPVSFFNFNEEDIILDATASPWSKTSQISSLMKNKWKIIAVDNNTIRIDKLLFTLKRQWCKNIDIIKSDARNLDVTLWKILEKEWWKSSNTMWYFDKILFDAPCSSEWRININSFKTYSSWNELIFKKHYRLSKQILEKIIPMLKIWWELIFSTCTLAPEENEAIVHFILCNYPDLTIKDIKLNNCLYSRSWIKSFWKQIYKSDVTKSIRILPSQETEWFFIAKFKRNNLLVL